MELTIAWRQCRCIRNLVRARAVFMFAIENKKNAEIVNQRLLIELWTITDLFLSSYLIPAHKEVIILFN